MMPVRGTSPSVGFSPTRPLAFAGEMIEPSVSVPMPSAANSIAMAAPVPELEPLGERVRS